MQSWEVLRDASERVGVKSLAAKLKLSSAMVYKWCQPPPADGEEGSGARNPLDRVRELYEITGDDRLINWLCQAANGFFTLNPSAAPGEQEEELLAATQRFVQDFGTLLAEISRSMENDGQISVDEADSIRQTWERLKGNAERFVKACEIGLYAHPS